LDDLEINKDNKSFKERIDFIKKLKESNNDFEDKFNLKKYISNSLK